MTAVNNRNGIRQIESDDEIVKAFSDADSSIDSPVSADSKAENGRMFSASPSKTVKPNRDVLCDKNGMPLLDQAGDLSELFEEKYDSGLKTENKKADSKKTNPEKQGTVTKHGIPVLEKGEDLLKLFEGGADDGEFHEILSQSLGDKSKEVLLKEKADRVGPARQLSVKKRLERYPAPQGEIDLHGYTSLKADMKAEAYIRNAFYNGTYTVRIIVGKGLHSKDGPVLPDVVEKRVQRMKDDKIVFAYEWDRKKKSKSGAITVYLNNYDNRAKI